LTVQKNVKMSIVTMKKFQLRKHRVRLGNWITDWYFF
jgi:hypothetical protein